MAAFNSTLFSDLQGSGLFDMRAKSLYPLDVPQRPQDFKPPTTATPARRNLPPPQPVRNGPWLEDAKRWATTDAEALASSSRAREPGYDMIPSAPPRRRKSTRDLARPPRAPRSAGLQSPSLA